MTKATYQLLELLALNQYAALKSQGEATLEPIEKRNLRGKRGQLRACLEAFWAQEKGGA